MIPNTQSLVPLIYAVHKMNLLSNTANHVEETTHSELVESTTEMTGVLITCWITDAKVITQRLQRNSNYVQETESNANCAEVTVTMVTHK